MLHNLLVHLSKRHCQMHKHDIALSICALQVVMMGLVLHLSSTALCAIVIHAGTANTFQLVVTASTAVCMATPTVTLSGSHFAWWARLTVGLGIAAILALLLCCWLTFLVRRKRRRRVKGTDWSLQQGSSPAMQAMSSATQPAKHCSHVAAYGIAGLPPDDDVVSVFRFSSAPEIGIKADSGLMQGRTALGPLEVDQAKMQKMFATSILSAALGNASSTSDDSHFSKKHGQQNAVNEGMRGASNPALQHMCKPSAGTVAAAPELSGQMLQMSLCEVELGPLLGQGAYGRVFKGT